METHPLDDADIDHEQRIRLRAFHLWEQDGRPEGQDLEYWERARELVGMQENPDAGQLPNPLANGKAPEISVEEAELQENLGEFPGLQSDQGDKMQTPMRRR